LNELLAAEADMEKKIDVLAVMDDAAHELHNYRPGAPQPMQKARAAVAELMEAATDAHDFAANMARNNGEELDRRFYRLRAAILNMSS
jgi:hypothetical protein